MDMHADSRRHFFSNRVIKRWNQLDQQTVDVNCINAFKSEFRYTRVEWASSWTSPLSPRSTPASEATQGE